MEDHATTVHPAAVCTLLGLPGFVVLAAGEVGGELEVLVGTDADVTGCPTRPTGPGAACAGSTSRSPRPNGPWPARPPVKLNRFVIKLSGGAKSVNRALEAKARGLAGLEANITNLPDPTPEPVIGAYQLWRIEQSFRMSNPTCVPGRSTTTKASRSRPT